MIHGLSKIVWDREAPRFVCFGYVHFNWNCGCDSLMASAGVKGIKRDVQKLSLDKGRRAVFPRRSVSFVYRGDLK